MLGAGCWEHVPGDRVLRAGCWELSSRRGILGAGFWEWDLRARCHRRWGGPANPLGLASPHVGAPPGSRYPGTTRLLPMSAVPFPGGISRLAPRRARLGGTQSLICTVLVSHKGRAVLMVTDYQDPSPKLRMVRTVRMVSQNNHSLSRAGDAQRCQPGFQGKPRCCEESSF